MRWPFNSTPTSRPPSAGASGCRDCGASVQPWHGSSPLCAWGSWSRRVARHCNLCWMTALIEQLKPAALSNVAASASRGLSVKPVYPCVCCTSSHQAETAQRLCLLAGLHWWQLLRRVDSQPGHTCRYPDVVVHRLLAAAIAKGAAGTKGKPPAEPCFEAPDGEAAKRLHVLRHSFPPRLTAGLRTGQQLSWQGARPPVRRAVCRVSLAACRPASAACRVPHLQLMVASHVLCLQVVRQVSLRVTL